MKYYKHINYHFNLSYLILLYLLFLYIFLLFPFRIKMETNSLQGQNLTIKEELEIISKKSNWCECCHEYVLKSETSKHFKSYENYRGLLKERFHKGKPNGFTCKICSVIYLKKWAMFKHFFSNHPIETIETGIILSIKDFQ